MRIIKAGIIGTGFIGPAHVEAARRLGIDSMVYVVATRLTGSFPGSPVEMPYRFTLRSGLISRLDIDP